MKAHDPRESSPRPRGLRDANRDSYPTDPCVVVRGKGLRELLLECEAKRAGVALIVDSGDTSGEIVLAEGEPYHAAYAGKIGLSAFVALLEVDVTLLRLAVPRTLSRYPRSLSLSLADLGVCRTDETRRFGSVFPPAEMPAEESSSLSLEGIEPRDGAVRISKRLMDAAWSAWTRLGPRAFRDATLHSAYVFGARDETLHLGGERLGRALLRKVISAASEGRPGALACASVDGMAAAGGLSQKNEYGCVVATREADAHVARELAGSLMNELRSSLERGHD